MSLGASLTSLARSTAVSTARLAWSAVRGVAHAVSGAGRSEATEARAGAWEVPDPGPVPAPEPAPLRDPIATEPTVASRSEAHGGAAGRHGDDLYAEAFDESADDVEPSWSAAQPAGDESVLDPGVARAVRSEAEVMQRAARPVKEP